MSQTVEPRYGWGKRIRLFMQRPAVIALLMWLVALVSGLATVGHKFIENAVIRAHHDR